MSDLGGEEMDPARGFPRVFMELEERPGGARLLIN